MFSRRNKLATKPVSVLLDIGLLLELGRIPLDIFARKSTIKNWKRIKLEHSTGLLLASHNDATLENLPWVSTRPARM